MLTYCLKCKKDTESVDSRRLKAKNGRTTLSPKCAVCGSKKSIFVKQQEVKELFRSLGLKTPLNKIPFLGDILFWV